MKDLPSAASPPRQAELTAMNWAETLRLSLDTLRVQKLRTFLTLLGVIIAVTTLVAVISVIEGMDRYIAERVANLGSNVFLVTRIGIVTSFQDFLQAMKRPPLGLEEVEILRERSQLAAQVGASSGVWQEVRYGAEGLDDVAVVGATANLLAIRSINIAAGRFFTDSEYLHSEPVCFLGADVVARLFPNVDAVGKEVTVGGRRYRVLGTARAQGTVFGQSQDNFVYLPLTTFLKSWHEPNRSLDIFVAAVSPELLEEAQDEARLILRARRHVAYDAPDNFALLASASITGLWKRLTGNISAIAVALTAVFLVVGGIVIMNIMLASVTERTREIGIRKSIGARRRHILTQFLMESSLLACLGGALGTIVAITLTQVLKYVTPLPMRTPVRAVVLALALATSVGLFFGIYPARRAARLNPIEALRYET